MHRDDHPFARLEDFVDVRQGEKSLIHPVQVDDVCSLEFGKFRDVCSSIGDIHLKEILPTEVVGDEDAQTFPDELERLHPVVPNRNDGEVVSLLIAHKHLDLDTVLLQGFHESVGGNRSTSNTLRCVND